jgi:hypothetical protein
MCYLPHTLLWRKRVERSLVLRPKVMLHKTNTKGIGCMTKYRLSDLQEEILRICYKKPIKSHYCQDGRTIELDNVITPAAIRLLYGG